MIAADEDREESTIRQRHNFIDDLESFFWVYFWIVLSHDGPGPERATFDSCRMIDCWSTADETGNLRRLTFVRDQFLRRNESKREVVLTSYFSQPPYSSLLLSLRDLFGTYHSARHEASLDSGRAVDYFAEIDEIYGNVLILFDAAIEEVPREPPLPMVGAQKTKGPLKTVSVSTVPCPVVVPAPPHPPIRRIQPDRLAKRPREEGPAGLRDNKRVKLAPPGFPPRVQRRLPSKTRIQISAPTITPTTVGSRRSERLRAMRTVPVLGITSAAALGQRKRKKKISDGVEAGPSAKSIGKRN